MGQIGTMVARAGGLAHPPMASVTYKLGAPRVTDHVRRGQLLERIAQSHRSAPLTWVVGLPGAGKTSAVARFAGELAHPLVWYRLDRDDADGASLFHAIAGVLQSERAPLPLWSPENQEDLTAFAGRFFAEIAASPLTLVIDDCHRVPDDAPAIGMLSCARNLLGKDLRVVLISRRAPPPSLSLGVVGGWLRVVDDLRLTAGEAREIAEAHRGQALSDAEVAALGASNGWLAHVLALSRGGARRVGALGEPGAEVGDFLAAELLDSVPENARAGLRRLAELPEIPVDLGSAAFLGGEALRLLHTLSAQGYFVDVTARGRFRLHDLLRDALLRMNAALDDEETRRSVRRELATLIAPQMPEAAMHLRALAKDVAGALSLCAQHGADWLASGLHATVTEWLRELPAPADEDQRASLALYRAQALLPLEPEAARPLFRAAATSSVALADAERAYAAWCGQVASYVIQWGAVHGLADLVDDLDTLATRVGPPPGDLSFRTSADALTALMYGRAEDQRMSRFAEETAKTVAHAPDAGARISAAAQLLIYKLWWAGDFPGGRALYATFDREVWENAELAPLPRLLWWSCASIVDWQCGEPDECYRKVERGLALAQTSGVHVRDFFLLTQGIFCALAQEDWPRAEQYLGMLAKTERTHKRLDVMVHHFFRSWYSLGRGDARTALAHAESAWSIADSIGSMFHKVIALSALAPARVHCGDLSGAEEAYRAQLALAKTAQNPTFSFIAFCAGAEIALAKGDEPGLRKQVERMLMVKHLGGFHSCCGWRTPMMQKLLGFALSQNILPEVARTWIREKRVAPPAPLPPGWPMPVQIEVKQGLVVLRNGEDTAPSQGVKGARKLRELLSVLVVVPDGATHPQLRAWLWPKAPPDKAAASLKAAVHRIRQWLGTEAIRVHDGRVSLNPAYVECDLWSEQARATMDPARVLAGFELPPIAAARAKLASPEA